MDGPAAVTDDVDLMLRVKEGDCISFALLLDRHRSSVERFLYGKVRNRALAEELAQEVFLRVYRARGGYQPKARFKAWLFQIAAHLGSNSRRDRRREILHEPLDVESPRGPALQLPDGRPTIEQEMVGDVRREAVRRAVAALPEKQRAVVLMHKFAGMEYSEIAEAFQCTESAVKSMMFRAHEALREMLEHLNAA
jgi:RNA polymerase sigma-70 factor (ECF subfamily)